MTGNLRTRHMYIPGPVVMSCVSRAKNRTKSRDGTPFLRSRKGSVTVNVVISTYFVAVTKLLSVSPSCRHDYALVILFNSINKAVRQSL